MKSAVSLFEHKIKMGDKNDPSESGNTQLADPRPQLDTPLRV